MIVYFIRHASAGERRKDARRDAQRGLDPDGMRQCAELGRLLALLQVQADAILSSPLKRAAQTAVQIGNEIGHEGRLVMEKALRPEAGFTEFRTMLERYSSAEALILVGHRRSLHEFLGRTIGDTLRPAGVELKKGAIAKVEIRSRGTRLQWCLSPRVIRTTAALISPAAATKAVQSRPQPSRPRTRP